MDCFLMAAGNGMRLRPLTENKQKCLLPVAGKPILSYWLHAVFDAGVFGRVCVNVHHCADSVEKWIEGFCAINGRKVEIIDERSGLLGTAGTLFWHADPTEKTMAVYTDTYAPEFMRQIGTIARYWDEENGDLAAGLVSFRSPEDGSVGIIKTDCVGMIDSFEEKGLAGNLAWAGIAFLNPLFVTLIRSGDRDLARDVFPRLCGNGLMRVIAEVEAYDIGRGLDKYDELNKRLRETSKY